MCETRRKKTLLGGTTLVFKLCAKLGPQRTKGLIRNGKQYMDEMPPSLRYTHSLRLEGLEDLFKVCFLEVSVYV